MTPHSPRSPRLKPLPRPPDHHLSVSTPTPPPLSPPPPPQPPPTPPPSARPACPAPRPPPARRLYPPPPHVLKQGVSPPPQPLPALCSPFFPFPPDPEYPPPPDIDVSPHRLILRPAIDRLPPLVVIPPSSPPPHHPPGCPPTACGARPVGGALGKLFFRPTDLLSLDGLAHPLHLPFVTHTDRRPEADAAAAGAEVLVLRGAGPRERQSDATRTLFLVIVKGKGDCRLSLLFFFHSCPLVLFLHPAGRAHAGPEWDLAVAGVASPYRCSVTRQSKRTRR